jgi:hypothetical protein
MTCPLVDTVVVSVSMAAIGEAPADGKTEVRYGSWLDMQAPPSGHVALEGHGLRLLVSAFLPIEYEIIITNVAVRWVERRETHRISRVDTGGISCREAVISSRLIWPIADAHC